MDLSGLSSAVTQIVYLTIPTSKDVRDSSSAAGKVWSRALDNITGSPGYQRLYWGRSVEQPDKIQLHVVRSSLNDHKSYLDSSSHRAFLVSLAPLMSSSELEPVIRHVTPMTTYTSSPTTCFNAPVTGSAIYLNTSSAWHEGAWPCWTHVVRHVPGCMGIAGGKLLEPFNSQISAALEGASAPVKATDAAAASRKDVDNCYLVYVGWESIKAHSDYHHTKHFRDHGVVLTIGNGGWREYGHVKFEGWRGEQDQSTGNKGARL